LKTSIFLRTHGTRYLPEFSEAPILNLPAVDVSYWPILLQKSAI